MHPRLTSQHTNLFKDAKNSMLNFTHFWDPHLTPNAYNSEKKDISEINIGSICLRIPHIFMVFLPKAFSLILLCITRVLDQLMLHDYLQLLSWQRNIPQVLLSGKITSGSHYCVGNRFFFQTSNNTYFCIYPKFNL